MKLLYLFNSPLNYMRAHVIQTINMCYAFQKIGIDVTLAVPKNKSNFESKKVISDELGFSVNFKIYEYPRCTIFNRLKSLGTYWGVISLLDKSKNEFDLCYTRNFFLAKLAIDRGFQTIYEEHDEKLHPSKLLNCLYSKILLSFVNSDKLIRFIAISQALADFWIKKGVVAEKVMVLHDGFSMEGFKTVKSQIQARSEIEIITKKKIVVYVGSLYKDRGIENIFKLAEKFSDVLFIVVGGPEKCKVIYETKALKEGLNNIKFIGRVPHYKVKNYLFAADILLMLWSWKVPTIRVCSPLKVFEYMASERIIVGQGFPTIKEVLTDGETALLASPDSFEDLKVKLEYGLSLSYPNDIAKRARNIALKNYSWEKRVKSIIDSLKSE